METLGQIKQRHKLEQRTLQNDIKVFRTKAKKERKSKKYIEDYVDAMEDAVKNLHDHELVAFGAENEKNDAPTSAAPAEIESADCQNLAKGATKAQRKREAKRKQSQERRERIEESNKNIVSKRQMEADSIRAQLARHGLTIKDIPSDGHCMYHAVADQIKQKNLTIADRAMEFQYLRKLTSEYMLAHSDEFLPFVALDESSGSPTKEFSTYCDRVANTADWGGQLELRALACALRTPIEIFSAESDVIVMGSEFTEENDESAKLQLAYHLHYYTLGEHFNSVTQL
ncbi:hypothetical protein CCR75_004042 [Bremia lactucae]|uniref:OTU domain-containing protein n=1 Tax=Bremia lactucae TaxID=4779 RepID=A0A976FFI8_BRELC|nr:hypothetical protein CCR75_004042 [Bremia lactucae]